MGACWCLLMLLWTIQLAGSAKMRCSLTETVKQFNCTEIVDPTILFQVTIGSQSNDIESENVLDHHLFELGQLCFSYKSANTSAEEPLIKIQKAERIPEEISDFLEWLFVRNGMYLFYLILIIMSMSLLFALFLCRRKIYNAIRPVGNYHHPTSISAPEKELRPPCPLPQDEPPSDKHIKRKYSPQQSDIKGKRYTVPQPDYDSLSIGQETFAEEGQGDYDEFPTGAQRNPAGEKNDGFSEGRNEYERPKQKKEMHNTYEKPKNGILGRLRKTEKNNERNEYEIPKTAGKAKINQPSNPNKPQLPPKHNSQQLFHRRLIGDMKTRIEKKNKEDEKRENTKPRLPPNKPEGYGGKEFAHRPILPRPTVEVQRQAFPDPSISRTPQNNKGVFIAKNSLTLHDHGEVRESFSSVESFPSDEELQEDIYSNYLLT